MDLQPVTTSLTLFLITLALCDGCLNGAESKIDSSESPPTEIAALKALETRAVDAIRTALPATVAVNVTAPRPVVNHDGGVHFEPSGSGVIISRDGLILS